MSRLIRVLFFFSMACTRFSNQHVDQMLVCGADLPRDAAWFTVADSRLQPLKADFEVIDLTSQRIAPIITRNGCVQKPAAGQYLIRSLTSDQARVVNAEDIEPGGELALLDYSNDSFSVSCNESAATVSRMFSLADVLEVKVLDNLRPAYTLDYELDGVQQSFSLSDAERLQLLIGQEEEKAFDLRLKVKNLLRNKSFEVTCHLQLDLTAPKASVRINSRDPAARLEVHGTRNIIAVGLQDSISFEAEADTAFIRYCAIPLDDDFESLDSPAGRAWMEKIQTNSCMDQSELQVTPQTPILTHIKSKFWVIRYQAVDAVGNASPYENQPILIENFDTQRLIQDSSMLSMATDISMKKVEHALRAEELRRKLPTRYERLLTRDIVRSALTRSYYQATVTAVLPRYPGEGQSTLAMNQKGTRLALAADSMELRMIDIESGRELWTAKVPSRIASLIFSADDQALVILDGESQIKTLDAADGRELSTSGSIEDSLGFVGISPSQGWLWLLFRDTVRALDPTTAKVVATIPLLEEFGSAKPSADGRWIVMRKGKILRFHDMDSGKFQEDIELPEENSGLHLLSSDRQRLILHVKNEMIIYNLESGSWVKASSWTEDDINTAVLSSDEKHLVIAKGDGSVILRRLDRPERIAATMSEQHAMVHQLLITRDGQRVLTYSEDDKVRIWNLNLLKPLEVLGKPSQDFIADLVFDHDGKNLMTLTMSGIEIWDLAKRNLIRTLSISDEEIPDQLTLSRDGKVLMAKSRKMLTLWNLASGEVMRTLKLPSPRDNFHSATLSGSGRFVVAGQFQSSDILIWDLATDAAPRVIKGERGPPALHEVALDPTDSRIASVGTNQPVRIWDFETGTRLAMMDRVFTHDKHLTFSNDGRQLTLIDGTSLRLWDLVKLESQLEYRDPLLAGFTVAIDSSGTRIMVQHAEGLVMWDLNWEKPQLAPIPDVNQRGAIALARDGQIFAVGQEDGSIALWSLDNEQLRSHLCQRLGLYVSPDLCP